MGEAKRKRQYEEDCFKHSKPIKRARFNAYTMGTRHSLAVFTHEELAWWSSEGEEILGMVSRDINDDDFSWMIFARDKVGRFRAASMDMNYSNPKRAEAKLRVAIAEVLKDGQVEEFGEQGDETNSPLDPFFVAPGQDREKLHPYFRILLEDDGRAPARAILSELALWLAPSDPHLVREFQTNGFDQRLWEFFLWAAFREFSLDVNLLEAPDFLCRCPLAEFTVEATTVAPSDHGALAAHPNPQTTEEREEFLRNYMPMKFGSALTSKLNKRNANGERYWERDQSREKPFLVAIADFHKPADEGDIEPMTWTQSALWQYLYGSRVTWRFNDDDQLIIDYHKIEDHQFNDKTVPSGFFDLPDAENVSAVIFSNAGTISKFDRMGAAAKFGADGYKYIRMGLKYNPDPNAMMGTPFFLDAADDEYEEWWTQEIQVFHNPNARYPLPFEALLGATHHYFDEGQLVSRTPPDAVLSSFTMLMRVKDQEASEQGNQNEQ